MYLKYSIYIQRRNHTGLEVRINVQLNVPDRTNLLIHHQQIRKSFVFLPSCPFPPLCFMPAALGTSANGSNQISSTGSQLSVTEQDCIRAIKAKVSWTLDAD